MKVTVIGGGTMGAGIAHLFSAHGHSVTVIEADLNRVVHAQKLIEKLLEKGLASGKISGNLAEILALVEVTTSASSSDADLVIEAVPEDLALKRQVLAQAVADYPRAVLASNTSSLSISQLTADLPGERILGMHFFNPVPVQPLVELVRHDAVAEETMTFARQVAESLGKTTIEVRDSPGFATSRLGVAVGLEAIRMLEEQVASAEDIDTGMRLGYGWPMGPLRLTDLIGLDVRLAIAEHLARTLGQRFSPPQLLRDKVAAGELGCKTGQGFFSWSKP